LEGRGVRDPFFALRATQGKQGFRVQRAGVRGQKTEDKRKKEIVICYWLLVIGYLV
jgi:hypothetical protein